MLLLLSVVADSTAGEVRSYAVSWFTQAVSSEDGDCPNGLNPDIEEQYRRNLSALGVSAAEIDFVMAQWQEKGEEPEKLVDLMNNRGRIDGRSVNAYAHPESVIDPKLHALEGKYAYGFDLDGRISPEDFLDPRTMQPGIDHQLFRALGCIKPFRGSIKNRPTYGTWLWTMIKDSMPAWLITVTGERLDGDGEVMIRFDRAMEHLKFNPDGETRAHMTFRISADSRSRHSFRGKIENGVLSITEPGPLRLLKDPLSYPRLDLTQTNLRLTMKSNGGLEGILGGYQPWRAIYFGLAQGGFSAETMLTGELPGIYYLLKRLADADPDPRTGQNRAISVAYRIEAVPAFVVADGTDDDQRQ